MFCGSFAVDVTKNYHHGLNAAGNRNRPIGRGRPASLDVGETNQYNNTT